LETQVNRLPAPSFFYKHWSALLALILMGVAVWVILPGMVVTLDDDFWYLRSVVETLQKGRPWTDDWLTPWAASATSVAALLYRATGSFTAAIHLQLAGAAGMAGMGLVLFLKRQGIPSLPACSTAVLLLLTPTVLFMFLMFTGVALYMACLWWCLLLADRRQWFWFLLPWGIALASRQSAITWLALPGWALLQEGWPGRTWRPVTPASRRLIPVFGIACGIFLTVKLGMNPTSGQKSVLGSLGGSWLNIQHLLPLALGGLLWLAGQSVASLVRLPWSLRRETWSRSRMGAVALLAPAGGLGARFFQQYSQTTHGCYSGTFSGWAFPVLGTVLGTALALAGRRPRVDASLAALGSVLLVSLYGGRFDYYFFDALGFGLAAGFPTAPPAPTPTPGPHPASRWTGVGLLTLTSLFTALWQGRSAVRLTAQQHYCAAMITLYEQAFRSGKLEPSRVGMASFGYLGWLFQDYYETHEGRQQPLIGGFTRYAQSWNNSLGTGIVTTLPKSLRNWTELIPTHNVTSLRNAPDTDLLGEIRAPLPDTEAITYVLRTSRKTEPVPDNFFVQLTEYQRIPHPLNDAEWRDFIRNHRLK